MEDVRDPNSHPKILKNSNPEVFGSLYENVTVFLQQYGWFILFGVLMLLYLKSRFKPQIRKVQKKVEEIKENTTAAYDPDVTFRRQEAMDAARRRMQEKYDAQTARHAEEEKKREEEKRKQKIEDWDNHLQGKGYRSKYKPTEPEQSSGATGTKSGGKKNVYRDADFSPLGGGGSMGGYRPPRRGGGGVRGGG